MMRDFEDKTVRKKLSKGYREEEQGVRSGIKAPSEGQIEEIKGHLSVKLKIRK